MYGELLVLRLAVGIIFIYHALPKLSKTEMAASGLGWPKSYVFALGLAELISGLSLIGGMATDLAAFVLAIIMVGAIYFKIQKWHLPFSARTGMGWEFDFVLLAANLTILFS